MDRFTEKLSENTKPKTLGGRIRRLIKPNGIYKATILKEYNRLYDRLVEYEDLGVTSEQVRQMDAEFVRISKELEEYRKAERQGLLLRLPCKAGDRVYLTDVLDEIVEGLVTEISILPDGICVYIEEKIGSGCSQGHGVNDFGYNVFLKREDAEDAFEEDLDE